MKHRQNSTSRSLRPRFRQQQKHKFLQSQRSKENSGPKKTLRTSHFHDFTFLPFLIYTYIYYHILYILSTNIKVESSASINNSKDDFSSQFISISSKNFCDCSFALILFLFLQFVEFDLINIVKLILV